MSDKKIELIAQLLAKAESTTPEEAEALTAAAEKLMVKYGIEQAMIDAKRSKAGQPTEQITTQRITFTGAYRLEYVHIGIRVSQGLGVVKNMLDTNGNKSATLWLVGYKSDLDQATLLINSLQLQSVVAVREWWKLHREEYAGERTYDQEAARRSFVKGFANGAGKRIKDNRAEQVQEAEQATTGTALVLVSRAAKVEEAWEGMAGKPRRMSAGKGSFSAGQAGFDAGQKANTGERAVSQGRGISA